MLLAVLINRFNNTLIVSEGGNRRVTRWSLEQNIGAEGEVIISNVASFGLALDRDGSLYVADFDKNEIHRYGEGDREGVVVAGGNGRGSALNQLRMALKISALTEVIPFMSQIPEIIE